VSNIACYPDGDVVFLSVSCHQISSTRSLRASRDRTHSVLAPTVSPIHRQSHHTLVFSIIHHQPRCEATEMSVSPRGSDCNQRPHTRRHSRTVQIDSSSPPTLSHHTPEINSTFRPKCRVNFSRPHPRLFSTISPFTIVHHVIVEHPDRPGIEKNRKPSRPVCHFH